VQLDAEPGATRKVDAAVLEYEWLFQVAVAQVDVLLNQEVRDAGVQLQAGGEGDRAERIVRRNGREVTLRHGGDLLALEDAASVAEIRLENGSCLLLKYRAESPLREEPLSSGDGDWR